MAVQRILPHDSIAEISVLGAILVDKESIIEIVEWFRPNHFYETRNSLIYQSMMSLYERGEPIDLVTLAAELKKSGDLEKAGGREYMSDLLRIVPTSAHIEQYARLVQEASIKRQLISVAASISDEAFSETTDLRNILDKTEAEIFSISKARLKTNFIQLKDTLSESFDRIDELHKRGDSLRGIPTGFAGIDSKLSGLQPANMIVIAARPGQGKTAFCLNIAQYMTVQKKIPIGIFSLEMSKEELVDRLLVAQADIDAWRLKTGKLTEDDFQKISDAMGVLADAPLFIDDTPGLNIIELRTKARRLQFEHGAKLFMVDYLQLMDAGRRYDNRVQEVSMISQSIKNIARELRVPIVAVSQLSRAVEQRGEKKPQLADLRESGAIEQDADIVSFLYRPQADEPGFTTQTIVKFLCAKHRNGATFETDLLFRGDRMRFYEVDNRMGQGGH